MTTSLRKRRLPLLLAILVLAVVDSASGDADNGNGATSHCDGVTVTADVPGTVSSITVQGGTVSEDERAALDPWCDSDELSIAALDVAATVANVGCPSNASVTTPPCLPWGMLAALEIEPTPVRFPDPATRPQLVYDLDANPPQEQCEDCLLKVYQLKDPLPPSGSNWRFVGNATPGSTGGVPTANANISHFSVFALVEVPPPRPVPGGGGEAVAIVTSEFIDVGDNAVSVDLAFPNGAEFDQEAIEPGGVRNFLFTGVELVEFSDGGCQIGLPGASLDCLYPIETEVIFTLESASLVVIDRADLTDRAVIAAAVAIS